MDEKNVNDTVLEKANNSVVENKENNNKESGFYISFATKEDYTNAIKNKVKNLSEKNDILAKENAEYSSTISNLSKSNDEYKKELSSYRGQMKELFELEVKKQNYEAIDFETLTPEEIKEINFKNLSVSVAKIAKEKNIKQIKVLEPTSVKTTKGTTSYRFAGIYEKD